MAARNKYIKKFGILRAQVSSRYSCCGQFQKMSATKRINTRRWPKMKKNIVAQQGMLTKCKARRKVFINTTINDRDATTALRSLEMGLWREYTP